MKTDNVLYTDGHRVTVTDSVLQVKKKWYSLNGITKHGISIIAPARFPAFLLLMVGVLFTLAGAARLITTKLTGVLGTPLDVNELSLSLGILLLLLGAGLLWAMTERYAVSITTAEGEKNVVVSRHKEYITQIVHALNDAFFARVNSGTKQGPAKGFMVSGR